VAELHELLIQAALATLPLDPSTEGDMVVGWKEDGFTEAERAQDINLPEKYYIPVIDDARPVAVEVVAAVLMELAKNVHRPLALQLLDVRDAVIR
jgi:hypothetical protein